VRNLRHRFIGTFLAVLVSSLAMMALGAESKPGDKPSSSDTARSTYLVVYRHGPGWVDGKPMSEQQSMREHFSYYLGLHRKGVLVSAGGFTDESGGAAIFEATDDAAAADVIAADPAVKSTVFRYELQRWKPVAWEEISRKRAERGE
jgi:uncharacterized protein YciI